MDKKTVRERRLINHLILWEWRILAPIPAAILHGIAQDKTKGVRKCWVMQKYSRCFRSKTSEAQRSSTRRSWG
jgi:hypothetical protein